MEREEAIEILSRAICCGGLSLSEAVIKAINDLKTLQRIENIIKNYDPGRPDVMVLGIKEVMGNKENE